jgi:ElaB/YqjD/DUF883 family membrane-anchored ribosome-binding protein
MNEDRPVGSTNRDDSSHAEAPRYNRTYHRAEEAVKNAKIGFEQQVMRHPWGMLGIVALTSIAFGTLGATLVERQRRPRRFGLEDLVSRASLLGQAFLAPSLSRARQTTQRIADDARGYVSDHSFTQIADDVSDLVRNHPLPATLIGIGLGYLASRRRH